ncbi:hypothetical protein ACKKBG_A36425 [Auxenochlorella protothecoides x Auxenochlorella symbiontica]
MSADEGMSEDGVIPERDSRSRDGDRVSSDRKRDRSRDHKEKHRHRSRSERSPDARDRDRHRSRDRYRDRSRERRSSPSRDRARRRPSPSPPRFRRGREDFRRSPPRRREPTPPEVRVQRAREKEMEKMDRDMRTIFAYNLALRAEEQDLFGFFVAAGPLNDIKIIRDRASGRSKGVAYVEYQRKEDVMAALALTGRPLLGQAVMVKMSEAEKNLAWEAAEAQKAQAKDMEARYGAPGADGAAPATAGLVPGLAAAPAVDLSDPAAAAAAVAAAAGFAPSAATAPCRLSVGNLHPAITEADLRPIFEPFGLLDGVALQHDAAGVPLGSAWVHFRHLTDATRAMQSLDRFTLVDREIRVTLDAAGLLGAAAVAGAQPPQPPQPSAVGAALNEPLDTAGAEDGGGLRLTSAGRTALMTALAANTGMQVPSMQLPLKVPAPTAPAIPEAVRLDQGLLGPASPIPTQCVLLKNMFDPEEESEPGWSEDIAADVGEECAKFGELQHLHVDAASKGFVYLKFVAVPAAAAAVQAMNGRWFAGKQCNPGRSRRSMELWELGAACQCAHDHPSDCLPVLSPQEDQTQTHAKTCVDPSLHDHTLPSEEKLLEFLDSMPWEGEDGPCDAGRSGIGATVHNHFIRTHECTGSQAGDLPRRPDAAAYV